MPFTDTITVSTLAYPLYVEYFMKAGVEIIDVEDFSPDEFLVTIQVERLGILLQIGFDIGHGGFSLLNKHIR